MGTVRSIREVTKALQGHFNTVKTPLSLPTESRRMLWTFVDEHLDEIDEEEAERANQELNQFWERYVKHTPQKICIFVGVLRELRLAISGAGEASVWSWYNRVVKPVICGSGFRKTALEDAQEFLAGVLSYDDEEDESPGRARPSQQIRADLLSVYMARTRPLKDDDAFVAAENTAIAQQVESVLIEFGKKKPKDLLHDLDDQLVNVDTRLQGLTLLNEFLHHQAPRLYEAVHTPLIQHLLKCLMNDTSTSVLSVALNSLIMLLPHIAASLNSHLPRLLLIYSRLLCWEKFSPHSTEKQRSLVTDDRVSTGEESHDHGDVGIDPTWQKARPAEGSFEASTPELLTYFTCLYGLFPLNFMSYIRKPRRYLKQVGFPGADDFDLDQSVIRSRSDQYREVHLLHPNFYNLTIEEELIDPKWPKMDPADVVSHCHSLCANYAALADPGPPPTAQLPDLPPHASAHAHAKAALSPSISHASLRSGHSWLDTQSTAVANSSAGLESPALRSRANSSDGEEDLAHATRKSIALTSPTVDEFPLPLAYKRKEKPEAPRSNVGFLQRENSLLRNSVNFERWHKAQHSQHIGQLMKKNVKDATVEAETYNLINANRALKQQLESVRNDREATLKDSSLTRKQASSLEANVTDRLKKMKKDQETWVADADELKKLQREIKTYRDLLSNAESRELTKTHQLEIIERDLEQFQKVQSSLQEAQRKVRDYEFREFDFERAQRELEIVQGEKDVLQLRIQRQEADRERTKRMYAERLSEMETQRGAPGSSVRSSDYRSYETSSMDPSDASAKLAQLKKAHARLLERYTDLELEYQSVKSQLETLRGNNINSQSLYYRDSESMLNRHSSLIYPQRPDNVSGAFGVLESACDFSEYGGGGGGGGGPAELPGSSAVSKSDPTSRRYGGHVPSEATVHTAAGVTWQHARRVDSNTTRGSMETPPPPAAAVYNRTKPLGADERSLVSGNSGASSETKKREKIKPNSEARVYGRGGAQNIKMKAKEPADKPAAKAEKPKASGFRGFKAFGS